MFRLAVLVAAGSLVLGASVAQLQDSRDRARLLSRGDVQRGGNSISEAGPAAPWRR